jgi:pimeloyl-ACP methyl ester carboxylesterase
MSRRTTLALVAGGALAAVAGGAVAWSRSGRGLPGIPKPVTGMFTNGMAYIRWGTGPKTLLWIVGGPGLGFPIGLRVALIPLVLRPFARAGYTCWLVNRKRDMSRGSTIADMAEDYAAVIADELGGKADLVLGEDYGGAIGFYLAAGHPERLHYLANASAGYALTERGRAIDRDFATLVGEGRPTDAWAQMLVTLAPDLRPPALVRALASVLDRLFTDRSRPDFVSNLIVETDAEDFDVREILPDVRVPVLLVGGDQGPFLSREILEETARLIPDCTLQLHEGKSDMGAVSTMELPRDVLAWVEERSRATAGSEPRWTAPLTGEAVSAVPATVPESSLAGVGGS